MQRSGVSETWPLTERSYKTLRGAQLLPGTILGVYLSAALITGPGHGDMLLKYPLRLLSTLIAITGVLMLGCSTSFFFVALKAYGQRF